MMLKLFRTACCEAKHSFFLSSFSTLVNLQECNGLRISHAYKNKKPAISFISSIVAIHQESLLEKRNETHFFSLLLDGSTDVSTCEQQIVCTQMLIENIPQNCFLGMLSLKHSTASNISEELGMFLTGIGVVDWKSKLVGLGNDGVSVNISYQGGLGVLLQKDISQLIPVHCECLRRLSLASKIVNDTVCKYGSWNPVHWIHPNLELYK